MMFLVSTVTSLMLVFGCTLYNLLTEGQMDDIKMMYEIFADDVHRNPIAVYAS